jgi:hypothetical protein
MDGERMRVGTKEKRWNTTPVKQRLRGKLGFKVGPLVCENTGLKVMKKRAHSVLTRSIHITTPSSVKFLSNIYGKYINIYNINFIVISLCHSICVLVLAKVKINKV